MFLSLASQLYLKGGCTDINGRVCSCLCAFQGACTPYLLTVCFPLFPVSSVLSPLSLPLGLRRLGTHLYYPMECFRSGNASCWRCASVGAVWPSPRQVDRGVERLNGGKPARRRPQKPAEGLAWAVWGWRRVQAGRVGLGETYHASWRKDRPGLDKIDNREGWIIEFRKRKYFQMMVCSKPLASETLRAAGNWHWAGSGHCANSNQEKLWPLSGPLAPITVT